MDTFYEPQPRRCSDAREGGYILGAGPKGWRLTNEPIERCQCATVREIEICAVEVLQNISCVKVVWHEIKEHSNTVAVSCVDKPLEICRSSIGGLDRKQGNGVVADPDVSALGSIETHPQHTKSFCSCG